MYRRLNIFLIIGAVFTIITGTLLHFVYEWSGESLFVGIFSPINESVWEHLKLLFFPMSVWILIGYFIFGKARDKACINLFVSDRCLYTGSGGCSGVRKKP